MNAEEAVAFLEVPFGYSGAEQSGEYLLESVQAKAQWILDKGERRALLEALRLWIQSRSLPRTILAISISGVLALSELRLDLISLRAEISSGRALLPYYVQFIDTALSTMAAATGGPQ